MYPRLVIDTHKFRHNVCLMRDNLAKAGVHFAAVTKVFCALPELVQILDEENIPFIADSRIQNFMQMPETKARKLLLRLPMLTELEEVVQYTDLCLISEVKTATALNEVAGELGKHYAVVIMVDLGDLREGVLEEDALELGRHIQSLEHLRLEGVGTNLTCFGGVLPTQENLAVLPRVRNLLQDELGIDIPLISGGNSSSLYMLEDLPEGINMLRVGEAMVLGKESAYSQTLEGFYRDIFTLEAELIEVKTKPSKPWGTIGLNAFGEKVEFDDLGPMRRGILGIGRQDVGFENLEPYEDVELIGASSDHTLVNLKATDYEVGDILHFNMDYSALLMLSTSSYVEKVLE